MDDNNIDNVTKDVQGQLQEDLTSTTLGEEAVVLPSTEVLDILPQVEREDEKGK
jgi:hypothetical protein